MAPDSPSPREHAVVLGFDYGERRTGVAVGQALTATATPLATLRSQAGEPDWTGIAALIEQWRPRALVVGAPATGTLAHTIRRFCHELITRFALPVHVVDESYSSVEAYRRLSAQRSAGRRARIARHEIDQWAAALMLESWLAEQAGADP